MNALDTRAALGLVYCPTCEVDTIPLEWTGRCAFCDTQLLRPRLSSSGRIRKPRLTLPATLRELREAHGLTQRRVARDLDLTIRTLYRFEHEVGKLRRVVVFGFAAYYGVEPDDIRVRAAG